MERLNGQLHVLGLSGHPALPFWSQVVVKIKRWHMAGSLQSPFKQVRLAGPSPYMSRGWVVVDEAQRVQHARVAILPDPVADQALYELSVEDAPGVPRTRVYGKQSLWPGPRWSPEACDAGRSPTDTEFDEEALRALTVEPALPAPACRAGGESFSDFEFSVLHTSTPSSSVIEGEHAKGVYVWPGDPQELTHALHEEHQGWQRMVGGILSEVPASEDDGQRLGKELQESID